MGRGLTECEQPFRVAYVLCWVWLVTINPKLHVTFQNKETHNQRYYVRVGRSFMNTNDEQQGDQKRKFSNRTLPNPVHIFLNYRLQTELNLNFFEQTQFKWTPYVEANRTNVAICFLYFKTYPYLANTIIMRK